MRAFFALIFTFFTINLSAQYYYWQQEVNHKIDVTLNDKNHTLNAFATIEYINNSPYIHNYLYFHIWPNAYKNRNTAFARQKVRDGSDEFYFSKPEEKGWIDNLDFEVNGKPVKVTPDEEYIDIIKIDLNEPLKPGETIEIKTPFTVHLPKTFSRLGHIGQSYQITQWYPKPAVYDREGWHPMPYLDQGEFYSEYGKFEVNITLPENYVVGATGVLQNETEKQWMKDRIGQKFTDDQTIISSTETKTLTYVQDNIHDFAWFADKRYNVKAGSVKLPNSDREVETWYLYHSRFEKSVPKAMIDLKDATYFYSKFVGDYPYSSVTAVTGPLGAGGGMEYPMITITDPSAIIHEVGHNWFYGILGTNERDFAWMDEGLNSFFENKTYEEQAKKDTGKVIIKIEGIAKLLNDQKITSEFVETRNFNQPMHHHSNGYHTTNYFIQLYQKPVILMNYLQDYLGEELFIKCFNTYYDRWKFKHPYIEDMQKVFEEVSGKDLRWLFETVIQHNVTPNTKIKKVVKNKRGVDALFVSDDKVPVKVNSLDKDRNKIGSKWIDFSDKTTNSYFQKANKLAIDDENMIFRTSRGKFSRSGAILQKYKLPSFDFLIPGNDISRANIGYFPVFGVNRNDSFMAGLAFYNTGIRSRRFNYTIAPMYSFSSKELKGLGSVNMNIPLKKDFQNLEIGLITQSFQDYIKGGFHTSYYSKPDWLDVSWNQKFKISHNQIYEFNNQTNISELSYELSHKDAVRKIMVNPKFGINSIDSDYRCSSFLTSIELKGAYEYMKNTRLKARFFAGSYANSDSCANFVFGLSNSVDYNRNHYIYSRAANYDFTTNGLDGGFRAFQNVFSDQLITWNTSVGIPAIPFSVYCDGGLANSNFYWGVGATLHLIDDNFEVYFPIVGTNYTGGGLGPADEFLKSIRVLLKLPLKSSNEFIWEKI